MRKIKLYVYPHAIGHLHDTIPNYRNAVPFSEDGIAKHCELVGPEDAEFYYCGQFADKDRHLLTPERFKYFYRHESDHIFDLEGDHSDSPIPIAFRHSLFTAMNATEDKKDWSLLVRPPCSMLLMDMVKNPRKIPENRQHGIVFIGKRDSRGIREKLYQEDVVDHSVYLPIYWEWTDKWNAMSSVDSPEVRHYEEEMSKWDIALCPPGEGQATVRYYEACGLGMTPDAYGSGLRFMDNLCPPELDPLAYFDLVRRYFNDPTAFFLDLFGLAKEKAA